MRRIWLVQASITGTMIAVTLLALIAGHVLGSTPAALRADNSCPLPCWSDIHPGTTRLGEAINILRNLGYHPRRFNEDAGIATNLLYINDDAGSVCQVGLTPGQNGIVREIILRTCDPLSVGDILNLIGKPDSMLPIASLMIFQDGQTILTLRQPSCARRKIYPESTIRFISLADRTLNSLVATQQSALPWRGFMPFWHYGQIFPQQVVC
ncbi:MAG: hypothetical protein ABI690_29730 [Chloroflexota bacterium]